MPGSLLLSVAIVTSDSFQSETELLKRKKNREIERERDLKKPCLIIIKIAEAQSASPLYVA